MNYTTRKCATCDRGFESGDVRIDLFRKAYHHDHIPAVEEFTVSTVAEARRALKASREVVVALFDNGGVTGTVRTTKGDAGALLKGRDGGEQFRGRVVDTGYTRTIGRSNGGAPVEAIRVHIPIPTFQIDGWQG